MYIGMRNKSPRWCPRWRCRQPAKWGIGVFQPAKWSLVVFPTCEMEPWCFSNPRNGALVVFQPAKWSLGVSQPAKWSIGVFSNPRNGALVFFPTRETDGWKRLQPAKWRVGNADSYYDADTYYAIQSEEKDRLEHLALCQASPAHLADVQVRTLL